MYIFDLAFCKGRHTHVVVMVRPTIEKGAGFYPLDHEKKYHEKEKKLECASSDVFAIQNVSNWVHIVEEKNISNVR